VKIDEKVFQMQGGAVDTRWSKGTRRELHSIRKRDQECIGPRILRISAYPPRYRSKNKLSKSITSNNGFTGSEVYYCGWNVTYEPMIRFFKCKVARRIRGGAKVRGGNYIALGSVIKSVLARVSSASLRILRATVQKTNSPSP
jgi:hypothetical protein